MFSSNNKISIRQFQMLFVANTVSIGIISLPRYIAEGLDNKGWILTIIGVVAALLLAALLTHMLNKLEGRSFYDSCVIYFGKPLGAAITVLFAAELTVSAGLELRVFSEIVKQFLLFRTPMWVIAAAMLLGCFYMAYNGIEAIGRLSEILFVFIFVILFFVFGIAAASTDYSNLFLSDSSDAANGLGLGIASLLSRDALSGASKAALCFRGLELIILTAPFIRGGKLPHKSVSLAVIIGGIMMTIISVITLARFGAADTKSQMWPTLLIMDSIEIPGSFVERQTAFMLSFWTISIFLLISRSIFFACYLLDLDAAANNEGKKNKGINSKRFIFMFVCVVVFLCALLPSNARSAMWHMNVLSVGVWVILLIAVPIFMLAFGWLKRIGRRE